MRKRSLATSACDVSGYPTRGASVVLSMRWLRRNSSRLDSLKGRDGWELQSCMTCTLDAQLHWRVFHRRGAESSAPVAR